MHEFQQLWTIFFSCSTIVFADAAGEVYGCNGQADLCYGEHSLSSRSFLSFKFDKDAIMKSCFESWRSAVLPLVFKRFDAANFLKIYKWIFRAVNLLVEMHCVLDQDYR